MGLRRLLGLGLGLGLSLSLSLGSPVTEPEEFVNPLCGTFTNGQRFSTGNTLPIVARPWGFNHWSVQTNDGRSAWWFGGNDHQFKWLRLTHQPSPWIGDWGWLTFGPQMGPLTVNPTMFWEPRAAHIKPHVFETVLAPDNMHVHFTPTDHGGVLQVMFPVPSSTAKRICFQLPKADRGSALAGSFTGNNKADMTIDMTVTRRPQEAPSNFGLKVRAEVDKSTVAGGVLQDISKGNGVQCFEFQTSEDSVTVWIGTSLISAEHAKQNIRRQIGGRSFDEVKAESKSVWNKLLRRIEVVDAGDLSEATTRHLTVFYTGLYRALIFPRRIDEPDLNGSQVHWSAYERNGGTYPGPLSTDNGFWDTFRTVYTLYGLAYPKEGGEIAQGWINAFKEGGWLPQWSSPGYRSSMVGTFSDVVIADAVVKGLPGLDLEKASEALRKDAFTQGAGPKGKNYLNHYTQNGYIPSDVGASDTVSLTLDFGFADYSAARAFQRLKNANDAETLRKRAVKARDSMFDASTGLMRPKSRSGKFAPAWDSHTWGNGYVEGNAWHHSFPPYDLNGLALLHGSKDKLGLKIKEMLEVPGTFRPGGYRQEIHEMTEARALAMGQYAHNNQPAHHILWLLLQLDNPSPNVYPECKAATREDKIADISPGTPGPFCMRRHGEAAIYEVLERAYGPEHYAGDEDNGEMGAWAVLAMLGLFETVPGADEGYVLGSPMFRHVRIWRDGYSQGTPIDVLSHRAGGGLRHTSKVLLDGQEFSSHPQYPELAWTLPHSKLVATGQIRFLTGSEKISDGPIGGAQIVPPPVVQPPPRATPRPTPEPTPSPTRNPTPNPTPHPTPKPTPNPTPKPTPRATPGATVEEKLHPEANQNPNPKPGPNPDPNPNPSLRLRGEPAAPVDDDEAREAAKAKFEAGFFSGILLCGLLMLGLWLSGRIAYNPLRGLVKKQDAYTV